MAFFQIDYTCKILLELIDFIKVLNYYTCTIVSYFNG